MSVGLVKALREVASFANEYPHDRAVLREAADRIEEIEDLLNEMYVSHADECLPCEAAGGYLQHAGRQNTAPVASEDK